MRWGEEVEFRGSKQTLDRRKLRCRNSAREYAELDWSIWAMAFAELAALREQLGQKAKDRKPAARECDPQKRSLANTMRALRKCMRNLAAYSEPDGDLFSELAEAVVQVYENGTDKQARYRPPNPTRSRLVTP